MTDRDREHGRQSRRGAMRTALVLAVVVMLIYMTFIGRAAFQYFSA
ncbi:MAG: hypothetical protein V2J10_02510 [Wenzhouxiangella sp.]|nr:hypothetical protein [Wenzhouxiangella sp.]